MNIYVWKKLKRLYKYSGKFDYQHKYKVILEAGILSTPGVITENIPIDVGTSGNMKKLSEINPPSQCLALLDGTQKHTVQNGSC